MSPGVWRIRRKILGLRQRDVADRAEMSQSRYSLLERGEAAPSAEESEAIMRVLELNDHLRREIWRATGLRRHSKS